jgi:hypothetical protein
MTSTDRVKCRVSSVYDTRGELQKPVRGTSLLILLGSRSSSNLCLHHTHPPSHRATPLSHSYNHQQLPDIAEHNNVSGVAVSENRKRFPGSVPAVGPLQSTHCAKPACYSRIHNIECVSCARVASWIGRYSEDVPVRKGSVTQG